MALFFSKSIPYRSMLDLQSSDCKVLVSNENVTGVIKNIADKCGFEPDRGTKDEYTALSNLFCKMFYQSNFVTGKNLSVVKYYWDYSIDLM